MAKQTIIAVAISDNITDVAIRAGTTEDSLGAGAAYLRGPFADWTNSTA